MYRVTGTMAAITIILLSPVLIPLAVAKTLFEIITGAPKDK